MAARVKFHTAAVKKKVDAYMVRNLRAAAYFVVREIKGNIKRTFKRHHGAAGLAGSIGSNIDPRRLRAICGSSNKKYARIHERGGIITPKNVKHLAIPLTDEARKSRGPRFMSALQFIPLGGGRNPLLARIDENFNLDPQFVLVKEVHIPARPYLRPAITRNRAKITKLLTKPIPKTGAG